MKIFSQIFSVLKYFLCLSAPECRGLTLRQKNKQMTVKFENLPKSEEEKKCLFSRI